MQEVTTYLFHYENRKLTKYGIWLTKVNDNQANINDLLN